MKRSKSIDYLLGHARIDDVEYVKRYRIVKPKLSLVPSRHSFLPITFRGQQYYVSSEKLSDDDLDELIDTSQYSVWSIHQDN